MVKFFGLRLVEDPSLPPGVVRVLNEDGVVLGELHLSPECQRARAAEAADARTVRVVSSDRPADT